MAADIYVKLSALTSLMALLQHTLNDRFASSKAPLWGAPSLSHDENRGEVHATTPGEADDFFRTRSSSFDGASVAAAP